MPIHANGRIYASQSLPTLSDASPTLILAGWGFSVFNSRVLITAPYDDSDALLTERDLSNRCIAQGKRRQPAKMLAAEPSSLFLEHFLDLPDLLFDFAGLVLGLAFRL